MGDNQAYRSYSRLSKPSLVTLFARNHAVLTTNYGNACGNHAESMFISESQFPAEIPEKSRVELIHFPQQRCVLTEELLLLHRKKFIIRAWRLDDNMSIIAGLFDGWETQFVAPKGSPCTREYVWICRECGYTKRSLAPHDHWIDDIRRFQNNESLSSWEFPRKPIHLPDQSFQT